MKQLLSSQKAVLGSIGLTALMAFGTGCETDAFCFNDCADGSTSTSTGSTGGGGDGGGFTNTATTGSFMQTGGGTGQGGCEPTNGGIEICDHADNDCNGTVDDTGDDLTKPDHCGLCDNNCYTQAGNNWDPATVMCAAPNPGVDAGVCSGECAVDYYDIDANGTCEYFCQTPAADDSLCNAQDDDCDGAIDEDVDLCTSTTDCGKCGGTCNLAHATPACVHTGPNVLCTPADTGCEIASCDAGYVDLDGQAITGCEYQCTPTGPETCGDQIDNDCDGLVDAADDLSGDPAIGVVCFGDPDGVCATMAHAGLTACVNGQVTCTGANVLHENDQLEVCNNLDDDCDGLLNDSPTDVGGPCGTSNTFPCTFGTEQCQNGMKVCVGAINPGTETCNGVDDNCDGTIDRTNGMMPADSVGACGGYPPPPVGATSPCVNGTKSCTGGTVVCNGLVGPTAAQDSCGVDANCDGVLTNQPNRMTDPLNCGTCGNNCAAGKNAIYACSSGMCQFTACLPGFYDLNNDGTCEYACTFISAQEACNNVDDNCNGTVDENPTQPSKTQLCGISPSASRPECTTQVSLTCTAGNWVCGFPAGVCAGGCSANDELCDGLDNDCDGFLNENVPDFGQPCASDDAAPVPGDGACRQTGTKVCATTTTTTCNATKRDCALNVGGCVEACDGIDNDCDGLKDEAFNAKGTTGNIMSASCPVMGTPCNVGALNFVKPDVTKLAGPNISGNVWMYRYEASRPAYDAVKNPKGASNTFAGSGNGFWTSALPGQTLDKTPACSVPNKIPWFNVTPLEVEQTCTAMGGRICGQTEWYDSCRIEPASGSDCTWGYSTYGLTCRQGYAAGTKFCNLAPSWDFDPMTAGDQDGLLPTASALLSGCYADWGTSALAGYTASDKLFDITGNLREITKTSLACNSSTSNCTYNIMGGAFNTQAVTASPTTTADGASCNFSFYATDEEFSFLDTGFRCCFTSDPRL